MKLAVKILVTSLFTAALFLVGARTASATTFGGLCPAVGANTDCEFLITINADNTVTVSDSGEGPYEPTDGDTLYGIQNNSTNTLFTFVLTGTGIFNFSTAEPTGSDGACAMLGGGCIGGDATGYGGFVSTNSSAMTTALGGDVVTFSLIDVNGDSGTVNFDNGIATGGSAWFSLEGRAQFITNDFGTTDLSTPEPGTLVLLGTGALALLRRRNRRSAQ